MKKTLITTDYLDSTMKFILYTIDHDQQNVRKLCFESCLYHRFTCFSLVLIFPFINYLNRAVLLFILFSRDICKSLTFSKLLLTFIFVERRLFSLKRKQFFHYRKNDDVGKNTKKERKLNI
jgi:hypothetical protein